METINETVFKEVKELKNDYLKEVEKFKKLGYSFPEYRARNHKIEGYKKLFENGIEIKEVVKKWNEL